jgi:hypothetical protein
VSGVLPHPSISLIVQRRKWVQKGQGRCSRHSNLWLSTEVPIIFRTKAMEGGWRRAVWGHMGTFAGDVEHRVSTNWRWRMGVIRKSGEGCGLWD